MEINLVILVCNILNKIIIFEGKSYNNYKLEMILTSRSENCVMYVGSCQPPQDRGRFLNCGSGNRRLTWKWLGVRIWCFMSPGRLAVSTYEYLRHCSTFNFIANTLSRILFYNYLLTSFHQTPNYREASTIWLITCKVNK